MAFLRWNNVYDPNSETHQALVKQDLLEFNTAKDKLMGVDKWIGGGISAEVGLFFIGQSLLAVILAAALIYKYKEDDRPKLSGAYQEKLNKLMDRYHWMLEGKTAALTNDPLFMDVVEAVAPFVESEELMPWDFQQSRKEDVSARYLAVLSQSPHRRDIVLMEKSGLSDYFASPAVASRVAASQRLASDGTVKGSALSVLGFFGGKFSQTYAESRRALYGYHTPSEERPPVPVSMTR